MEDHHQLPSLPGGPRRIALGLILGGIALILASFFLSATAHAQQSSAPAKTAAGDPRIVILRTEHPRIAYRQLPVSDMPVHTEATTFPLSAFGAAMEEGTGALADEGLLGVRATSGVMLTGPGADANGMPGLATWSMPQGLSGGASAPLGAGASSGTSTLGGTLGGLSNSIQGALQKGLGTTPGGGP